MNDALRALAVHLNLPDELLQQPGSHHFADCWSGVMPDPGPLGRVMDTVGAQLTEEYLRPALRAMGVPHPEQYSLSWEATP